MLTDCRKYRLRLMEMARGAAPPEDRAELAAHLRLCASCARALEEQVALSSALDRLAAGSVPEMPQVEARVLAEFDRTLARRRMARWVPLVGLAAAGLVGVVLLAHRPPAVRPPSPVAHDVVRPLEPEAAPAVAGGAQILPVAHKGHRQSADDNQPFLPIPFTVPPGPEERTTIVRMEIPVAALIAAGFDVPVVDPGAMVIADVLVGQDGRARAIRPVAIPTGK